MFLLHIIPSFWIKAHHLIFFSLITHICHISLCFCWVPLPGSALLLHFLQSTHK
ncbi:hypothetical protein JHK85_057623 [Glycine max]|nr:hypothetical protein JHK85_057623 [Glycine max]